MADEEELLQKLRNCIEQVGGEYTRQSDARFISEFSLKAELAHLLWMDKELWAKVPIEKGGIPEEIPLVFIEWYAAVGKKFDLALLSPQTIEEWATDIRNIVPGYPKEAAKLSVLAVIEVKGKGVPWHEEIREDINKIKKS